jgi:hypothetical protein
VKPWQPILKFWKTVPKPNPGEPGDDKNFNTKRNEFNSSDTQQLYHAAHAYVHVPLRALSAIAHFLSKSPGLMTGLLYL